LENEFPWYNNTDWSVWNINMQNRGIETKQQILQSAAACFSKEGYEGTGVSEICTAAGVSKGAFYHHFPSKHTVFMTLLEDWLERLEVQLRDITHSAGDVPSSLIAMTQVIPGVFADANQQMGIYLEFWAQATRDPLIFEALIKPYHRYTSFFSALLQKGMEEGSFTGIKPEIVSKVIISLALGVLLQGMLDSNNADWQEVAESGMRMITNQIKEEQ